MTSVTTAVSAKKNRFLKKIVLFIGSLSGSEPEIHRLVESLNEISCFTGYLSLA